MRKILFVGLLTSISWFAVGQDKGPTPAQTLRLARATYEQGRLHEITQQLSDTLFFQRAETTKAEKVEGYKLLCLTYIYLEEPKQADQAMLNLKNTDHYFEPNPQVDPAEFVALFNTFRKPPIYRIGARLGVNSCRSNITEMNAAVELGSDSEVKPGYALHFGAAIDVPFGPRLTLHGELLYLQHKFEIDEKVERIDSTGAILLNEFAGIEKQTWLSIPLCAEYSWLNPETSKFGKRFNPYVSGGFSIGYLLNAEMTSERPREDEAGIPESSVELSREKINLSAIVATGIKVKIASGLFITEVRYAHGLTNVSSQETAFENQKLLWDYGYADPVFKMSSLSITFSYVQDIFKPKKLTNKK